MEELQTFIFESNILNSLRKEKREKEKEGGEREREKTARQRVVTSGGKSEHVRTTGLPDNLVADLLQIAERLL